MTDPTPASPATPPPAAEVRSPLSDGEWHRMHPLTPLFRGGLVLVIVAGVIIANMRDRLIAIFARLSVTEGPMADPGFDRTVIEAVPEGWWYAARLPSGAVMAALKRP